MQRRDPAAQILIGNLIEIYGSEPFGQFCLGRKLPDRIGKVSVCLFIAGNHGAYSRQNVTEVEIEQGRQHRERWFRKLEYNQCPARPDHSTHFTEPAPGVLEVAQAKRDRQRVEAVIGKWKIQSVGLYVSDRQLPAFV